MDDDEEFDKAVGQFRLRVNRVMNPLRKYGQDAYVDSATEEIVSLAIQLHQRFSGLDEQWFLNEDKLHW